MGGGCINQAVEMRTSRGTYFLKWNQGAGPRFFEAEADGLAALARAGAIKTPEVAARSALDEPVPWLLLEWIDEGRPSHRSWSCLGRKLAALHRAGATRMDVANSRCYGWDADNMIGSLPQPNGRTRSWPEFWAQRRILPLVGELQAGGVLSARQAAALEAAAEAMAEVAGHAAEADGPSLLHGDLWSGNMLFDGAGDPVLIDPAVYVGHREVDLAMARLFGGFAPAFYRAYEEAWPLRPGHEARRSAYQIYPLLVHARLFGGGYASQAVAAAEAVRTAAATA